MELVTPGIGLIFWTSIVFILLIFLLKKFAWGPILKAVDDRNNSINEALSSAEKAKSEMERLSADNKKILNVTNTYDDKFFNKTKYFSDSRGQFNHGNPLDSDEFKKGLNIQLLTHPIWWIGDGNNVNERLKWFKKHKIDMIEKSLSDNLDFYGK